MFKIKKTVLKLFSIYRRLLSYDPSYGLLLVLRSRYPWSLTSSNHKGVESHLESEGDHVRRTRHIQWASMPPSPVSRTNSRSYPFVTPTRQSLDTNQRCQTSQHGQSIIICRPDRETIVVRLPFVMLKEKSWFLAQASAGASQTPRATYETVLSCIPYRAANWLVWIR